MYLIYKMVYRGSEVISINFKWSYRCLYPTSNLVIEQKISVLLMPKAASGLYLDPL